ncbi:hypothetical protein [Roseomonas xinghualingensis]|uniref:hypothetical protein n=1 Tax=Roseomonas xinghualingensis TaxID=2986475 RepID=UPI0021F12C8F|nr:hypothetical protein [Roseomonas sp. SXEYE001]MCV4209009.1 hypothetical protein [Roseomonas sp. SXEYE001]
MADDRKSEAPGILESWGTKTKNARPSSVGQHDPIRDPDGNPSGPGLSPEADYKAKPDHADEASAGPAGKHATVPVKEAGQIKPGAERDAPPLRGTAQE